MKTLMQIRNGLLQKFNKKRKLDLCSDLDVPKLSDSSCRNRIGESPRKKLTQKLNQGEGQICDSLKNWIKTRNSSKKQKNLSDFLKKQSKISEAPKKQSKTSESVKKLNTAIDSPKKQNKTTASSKKENKTSDSSKKQNKACVYLKKQKKTSDSSKKQNNTTDTLKKQNKTSNSSKKQNKTSDSSKKQNKTTDCSKKHNQTTDCSKKHNKTTDCSKKHDKTSRSSKKQSKISDSSKDQSKACNLVQTLSSSSKDGKDRLQNGNLKRRRRHKIKKDKVALDQASQLQKRARYLLVKLKLEQNLIDAYSGEGWKGQSREKIKPEKELQRAKMQILKCKLGIRDTVHQLDLLASSGKIDDSLMSPDGSVHHEHIFCKKCKTQEVSEDNDIILCDGTCNCAFHQKCIDPPLATEDIPPEDQGWLCKYCDSKIEVLEAVNAHLGTEFSVDSTWEDVFKEEARLSDVGARDFNPEEEWPDDESDDDDYDPVRDENSSAIRCSTREDSGSEEDSSTSSSCCSLESEVHSDSGFSAKRNKISSNLSPLHHNGVTDSNEIETISGPRQRSSVNYRQLYDEMFGKETSTSDLVSEDEDWGPRKRRRREKESDAASTLMTLCENGGKHSDLLTIKMGVNHLPNEKAKKPHSKIPCDALQKLRQAFAENELPTRDVKKNISELMGLEYQKVNKWFKNARYLALKKRKREGALHGPPSNNCDSEVNEIAEVNVSKCNSINEKKQLKKVCWNSSLTSLTSPAKQQPSKETLVGNGNKKANMELSDDMSLKKHLLYLKAKSRQKKGGKCGTDHVQAKSAEMQMEQLCWLEAKLWKLKQVLLTIQRNISDESREQCLKENMIYIPIAEVKEKALC